MYTVIGVVRQSVRIADELELRRVLVVTDEAVLFFPKRQQVRWKNELYSQRRVVRLGDSAALEKGSKIYSGYILTFILRYQDINFLHSYFRKIKITIIQILLIC